jgi:NADPH:quinone reductase-like Zn-dependent oxidoreductase
MRAFRFSDPRDSRAAVCLRLSDEACPAPQRGEVTVSVEHVSLNYRDVAIARGSYIHPVTPGLIPCSDACGVITSVGPGVHTLEVGDRVISAFHPTWFGGRQRSLTPSSSYGSGVDGWLAERRVVSQEALVKLPDTIPSEYASTLPCAAATAWNALNGDHPVRAGDTVLTLGTGGVSIFAIQLAKAMGARVIATTSTDDKAHFLRTLGVDEVVNYHSTPAWGAQVRALTGDRGVDRVVEVGGAGTFGASLEAVARGGEIVLIGFLTGTAAPVDFLRLKGSEATVRSISVGDRTNLETLVRAVDTAKLKPIVDRMFDFEEAPAAFSYLDAARHIGKIVIRVQRRDTT